MAIFKAKMQPITPASEPKTVAGINVELPAAVHALMQQRATIVSDQQRVGTALAAAKRELAVLEVEREEAAARLSAAEVDSALTGTVPDQAARLAVLARRDSIEYCRARINGLESRHAIATDAAESAGVELQDATESWQRQLVAATLTRYQEALDVFVGALHQVHATAMAIPGPTNGELIRIGFNVSLWDPSDPKRNRGDMRRRLWQSDPVAMELNKAITAALASVNQPTRETPPVVEAVA